MKLVTLCWPLFYIHILHRLFLARDKVSACSLINMPGNLSVENHNKLRGRVLGDFFLMLSTHFKNNDANAWVWNTNEEEDMTTCLCPIPSTISNNEVGDWCVCENVADTVRKSGVILRGRKEEEMTGLPHNFSPPLAWAHCYIIVVGIFSWPYKVSQSSTLK